MKREFKASRGFFVYIFLFSFFMLIIFMFVYYLVSKNKEILITIAIIAGVGLILFYILSFMKYLVDSRHFTIKIGIFSLNFDLKKLEKIYFMKTFKPMKPLGSFRVSLKFYTDIKNLIFLRFKKSMVIISPQSPEKFIEAIKIYLPDIEVVE